jgi:hypothetical protein
LSAIFNNAGADTTMIKGRDKGKISPQVAAPKILQEVEMPRWKFMSVKQS